MRRTISILASASAVALIAAAPASAQSTAPAAPNDPAVTAQTQPAADDGAAQTDDAVQTATGQDQAEDDSETIVVTGLRRSLQSARNIKRNSDQIVDVVVAEDIGKLPDRTVSEALARIPGITLERAQGEGGDVLLRGLRDPITTFNGRDIFTAEARNVAPQDFPAGSIAAIEVYKSLTAEQIEGNIAGLINVRGRRPFDFKNPEVSGSVNATYADLAKDWAWNGNLLATDRWDTGIGEIGVLANISYTELSYKDNIRFNSGDFFGINPRPGVPGSFCDNFDRGCLGDPPPGNVPGVTVRVPAVVGLFQNDGKRWRPSGNAAVQWKANEHLQFYADALYQGYRREVSDRALFVPMFDAGNYTNVTILDSGSVFDYAGSLTGRPRCCGPDGFQAATKEKTNTYQFAAGGIYENDSMRVSLDLARTKSKFKLSILSVDYRLASNPTINADFDTSGDGGAEFDFGGFDPGELSNLRFRGFFDRELIAKGDDYQARLDATFKDVTSFLPAIDIGVRYSDRDGGFINAERYGDRIGTGGPLSALPLDFTTATWKFRDGNQNAVDRLAVPTYNSIRKAVADLRNIVGFLPGAPVPGGPQDRTGPFDDYTANEKALTGYAQARYAFDTAWPIDGVIGLRVVRTETQLDGVVQNSGVISPLSIKNEYVDYLPNASIRIRPSRAFQIRAAYTETRRRPDFGQLNPGLRLNPPPPPGPNREQTGLGGNPFLKPINSNNYDLSFEYYFSQTGFASLALFRRKVRNWIIDSNSIQTIPGVGPVRVFGPANSDKGLLQGVEAQARTFFDFEALPKWAHGFGAEVNITYIDGSLDAPPNLNDQSDINFPDLSKWSYNLVGFYEQGKLTARVAYNARSKFTQFYNNEREAEVSGVSTEFTKGTTRLDASMSYAFTDKITLGADVSNILGKPFRNYRTTFDGAVVPRDVRYEERVYSIGLRARL